MGLKLPKERKLIPESNSDFDFLNAYDMLELVSPDLKPEPTITASGKNLGTQKPTQIRYFTFNENLDPETARERISENFESKYFGKADHSKSAPLFTDGFYEAKSVRDDKTNARNIEELDEDINKKENELEKLTTSWYIPFTKNYTKDKGIWDYVTNLGIAGLPAGMGLFISSMSSPEPEYLFGAIGSAALGGIAYLSHLLKYDDLAEKKENELETMKADSHFYKNFRRNVESSRLFVEPLQKMKEAYNKTEGTLSIQEKEDVNHELILAYQTTDKTKSPYEGK